MSKNRKVVIVALILIGLLLFESYHNPLQMYASLMEENAIFDQETNLLLEEIDEEIEADESDESNEADEADKADESNESNEAVITEEEVDEVSPEDGEQLEEYLEEGAVEEKESEEAEVEEYVTKEASVENTEVTEEVEKNEEHLEIKENVEETRVLEEIVESGLELEEVELNSITPQQGLADITILNNPELSAELGESDEGKPVITLTYKGRRVLNLGLLTNTYIIINNH